MSMTVTVKLQKAVLPDASVAVQFTTVVPFWKIEPDAGVQFTVTAGQLSVAGTTKVTTASHCPGAVLAVMFAGQVIAGG